MRITIAKKFKKMAQKKAEGIFTVVILTAEFCTVFLLTVGILIVGNCTVVLGGICTAGILTIGNCTVVLGGICTAGIYTVGLCSVGIFMVGHLTAGIYTIHVKRFKYSVLDTLYNNGSHGAVD